MVFNELKESYSIKDNQINNLVDRRFCVFDLEATGLDFNNEFIIQIGAVVVEDMKIDYTNTFKTYVKSPKQIPVEIEKLTSITNHNIISEPVFAEVFEGFREFAGNSVLVAQCGFEFDFYLLKKECERNNLKAYNNIEIDTKVLFANIHNDIEETFSTDYLLKYYEIYSKDVKRHDALGDSILISRILIEILNEYREKGINDFILNKELVIKKFIPKLLI